MRILRLHLKKKWWDQIKFGEKLYDYRLLNQYWKKRLTDREYDEIHICLGYPKAGDESRILRRRWAGVTTDKIVHEEFGDSLVDVFKINVAEGLIND